MQGIVPQQLFRSSKLEGCLFLSLLGSGLLLRLLLFLRIEFDLVLHDDTSSSPFKENGKGLRARCSLPRTAFGRLLREGADLFVAQLLICDQQQQQPILRGQPSSAF